MIKKVFVVLLIIALALCMGCSKDVVDKQDGSSELPESLRDTEVSEDEDYEPSSFDLIEKGLEAGDISKEEAVSLQLVAGYFPDDLPKDYQSEFNYGRSSLQDAKVWLHKNWDSLDEGMQEQLLPFYVPHSDPRSFIYAEDKSELLDALEIIPSVDALLLYDSTTVSIDGMDNTIFWKQGDSAAQQRFGYIKEALVKAWKHHKDL